MNKVTLFCMHNFELVLCYYGFGEAARFLENIKLAKRLQMAAGQKYFCTASCIIFLPYLPSARLIFSPPKKMGDAETPFIPYYGYKRVYNMLVGSML
jgi:hypothetical protein